MIYAGIDVNIITHEKALEAGVEAFGLWAWGMCYAQLHHTDGRLPRVAVLSALAGRRNIMHAKRLVEARLWTANEDGSWSIFNYGKKNQTADEIRAKKEASADRVRRWRERRNAPGNADVTPGERVRTDPPPTPSLPPDNTTRKQEGAAPVTPPVTAEPDWVDGSIEAVSSATGETFDRGVVWTTYQGSRESAHRPIGAADFRKFLGSWASRQKSDRVNARERPSGRIARGAEITKQPFDPNAPWLKLEEVG